VCVYEKEREREGERQQCVCVSEREGMRGKAKLEVGDKGSMRVQGGDGAHRLTSKFLPASLLVLRGGKVT
jgi:hypothetical protein